MKKAQIYSLAIFYQNRIANKELSIADIRYFRDTFKSIVELAATVEKDRQDIIKWATELTTEQIAEITTLFDEEYEVVLSLDIDRLDSAGIKITAQELSILE